ncbi:MAG: malate/L-lactate dehydrogenase subfamily protein [Gammaproteobacteria bacterium]|jgi:L-2-hydroxycarboxylate dehydrogenase (NAD+)|nr:malate/L-lactate dehydrogenase subfamily protein [Gammaproteobacteria bacterium]
MTEIRKENPAFLEYAICRVAEGAGLTATHARYIAEAIVFAHRQGKLNQGLGVYEAIDLVLDIGVLDPLAVPEMVSEGPAFAVFNGNASSGYYTLNLMAKKAIEIAKETGIAIVFGSNHNDGGSFARYVYLAYEQDMMAIASNNTVPLAAPFGGMFNLLSCPPFDAIVPSGDEPPIWASLKFAEWYDADISEAVLQNQPMKGKWLIDPESGEVTDDARPYAKPIPGYGRVWDASCAGQIETPRTYALNLWNEGLAAIINPLGIPSSELPTIDDFANGNAAPSVGGSYYICIDPSRFGPIEAVKEKSDKFIREISNVRPRPGQRVRIPGEDGYRSLQDSESTVDVLENHWQPFFDNIAAKYGLNEAILRDEFETQSIAGST